MVKKSQKTIEEISKEHEQIKLIISSIGEGLIVIDDNYKITIANKAAKNILKMPEKDLLGKNIKKVITILKNKKKLSSKKSPLEKIYRDKKTIKIKLSDNIYYQSASGKIFPVEASIEPLYKSKFHGIVMVFKDITDLKLIEEEREFSKHNLENVLKSVYIERDNVQKEKNKLQSILDSIGDAVFAINKNKKVMLFNSVAEKITGFNFSDMENLPYNQFFNFIDEKTKKPKTQIINEALKGKKETSSSDLALFTKNKELVIININASPIKNQREEILGCIVVFRDVTEKRETEKMRSDFISTVSHQLRTPLSAMKWFLEILLNEDTGKLKPEQKDVIEEIQSSNQNMINFVNQMLSVSRIENDTLAINPEIINLDSSIKEIIEEITLIFKDKKQELKFKGIRDKSLEIKIDKNLLRNIIHNLLTNASRYTPNKGKIVLSIKKKSDKYLLFKVKDNGIGIPEKERHKLFKKFSRGNNAIKYEANGTGLGLYIIKSILDLVGGKIWFESQENKGTTFFFTLPIDSMFCSIKKNKYK